MTSFLLNQTKTIAYKIYSSNRFGILIGLFVVLTNLSFGQSGTLDPTFTPGTAANNKLAGIALQADGKSVIVGDFLSYNGIARSRIARLNTDGTLDLTFNPGAGADASILSPSIQNDGKIVCCGNFANYNGTAVNRIVRINTDGSLDATFNSGTGADGFVYATALQSDGKIIIGGLFTHYNGVAVNRIARLNTDGSLDLTFNIGTGFNSYPYSITVQNNDKLVIGGNFTNYNGSPRSKIIKLNADGTIDNTFAPITGANNIVYATAVQSDGKIIIGGSLTSFNSTARTRLARLNTDGTLDLSFSFTGSGINNIVFAINIASDGKIIIGGQFTSYNGTSRNRIACLNSDGSLNTNFNPGTASNGIIYTSVIQTDRNILIGGAHTIYNGTSINRVARLNKACLNATSPSLSSTSTSICIGQTSTLTVSSGTLNDATNWQWYDGGCGVTPSGSGNTINVTPTVTTVYYVRGEGSCTTPLSCSTITVTVNPLPILSITGASTVCSGYSSTLTASGANSYAWSNGASTAMTSVTPTTNTTYSVTGTDNNGCSNTASTNVSPLTCVPSTSLQALYCSTTLTSLSDRLKCVLVSGASKYEWQVTDIATSTVYLKQSTNNLVDMYLSLIPQVTYNKSYSIKVRAYSGGIWGVFSNACTITTPGNATTKLQTVYCSSTLTSLSDRLKCDIVPSTTKYEWEVTDIATNTVYLKQSANNLVDMYLSLIPQVTYNKTYSIRVRAYSSGIWTPFGTSCNVTTPLNATTKLQTVYCSSTLTSLSDRLKCDVVPSTTKYEWEVTDIATSAVYLKQSANSLEDMYLSYIPQVTYNKSYSIRVRALSGGVWGTFGTACTVTTPASGARARFALSDYEQTEISTHINVNVYPNPTSEILNIDFDNVPANASVEVYNMIGELVLKQSLNELNNIINTTQLSNGLYHAKIIGNNKLLSAQKIVKQ